MSVAIKKIEVDVGNKLISLTSDQAKKLKDVLNELYGGQEVVHEHHYRDRWYPYHYPTWNWQGSTYTTENNSLLTRKGDTVMCALGGEA